MKCPKCFGTGEIEQCLHEWENITADGYPDLFQCKKCGTFDGE